MWVFWFLIILGLLFIIMGLSFHLGYLRRPIIFWTTFTSGIFSSLPLGIALLLLGFSILLPPSNVVGKILFILAMLFSVLGIAFGLMMPLFLTPWWFRYLREKYDGSFIVNILLKDAAIDYAGWRERTKTLKGLECWADEVRQKYERKKPATYSSKST